LWLLCFLNFSKFSNKEEAEYRLFGSLNKYLRPKQTNKKQTLLRRLFSTKSRSSCEYKSDDGNGSDWTIFFNNNPLHFYKTLFKYI
jgi:hypothetical protein